MHNVRETYAPFPLPPAGLPAKLCNDELSVFNLMSLRVHGKTKTPPPRRRAIIKRLFAVFVAPCPQVKSNSRSFLSFSVFKTKGEGVTLSRRRHCIEFVLNDESKKAFIPHSTLYTRLMCRKHPSPVRHYSLISRLRDGGGRYYTCSRMTS